MSELIVIQSNAADVDRWLTAKSRNLPKAISGARKEIEREAMRRYRRTTSTWGHKPEFKALVDESDTGFEMLIGTDDPAWNWTDQGTRPHIIRPRVAKRLRFLSSFTAKTAPGSLTAGKGGSGGAVAFRLLVHHPGTRARHFTALIQADMNKEAPKIMRRHLERWAR